MAVEPPDTPVLRVPPEALAADWPLDSEILLDGGELSAGWVLAGYRAGIFPMPHTCPPGEGGCSHLYWYSPTRRGVMPLTGMVISRSLRAARARHEICIDTAFEQILIGCARNDEPDHQWLTPEFADVYRVLHELGWAHSIESWTADGELAGGVLGVEVGGLFAGDSMVSFRRDGSKVALAGLVELLAAAGGPRIFDTQWLTPHLASLGGIEIPRAEYHHRLSRALTLPPLFA